MPTIAQVFYPHTTDQDQTWGTDIRKLDTVSPATNSFTLTFTSNPGGNLSEYFQTVDPYTNTSAASPGNDNKINLGWAWNEDAVDSDAMDSEATAKRKILAGTWTFTMRVGMSNPGGTENWHTQAEISVYRVASGGGTRTLLFTMLSNEVVRTAISAAEFTLTASGNQSEIILEAGETLHIGMRMKGRATPAIIGGLNNAVLTFYTGTQSAVTHTVSVPSPGIRTSYSESRNLKGEGRAVRGAFFNEIISNILGKGNISPQRTALISKGFNLKGIGFNVRDNTRIQMFFDLFGDGIATLNNRETIAAKTFNLIGEGAASRSELMAVLIPRSIKGQGISSLDDKSVIASKDFDLLGEGNITENHPVAASRTFNLIGEGRTTREDYEIILSDFALKGEGDTSFTKNVIASKSFDLLGEGFLARDNNRIRVYLEVLGEGKLDLNRQTVASRSFSIKGEGIASVIRNIQLVDFALLGEGDVDFTKALIATKSFDLVGEGAASRNELLAILLPRDVSGKGSITEVHPIQAFRTFDLTGEGHIETTGPNSSTIEIPIDEIPTEGGSTIITKKILFVFDD